MKSISKQSTQGLGKAHSGGKIKLCCHFLVKIPQLVWRAWDLLVFVISLLSSALVCSATESPDLVVVSNQGTLILILKGEVSVQLTSSSLLVRNQLFQEKLGHFLSLSKQPNPNR